MKPIKSPPTPSTLARRVVLYVEDEESNREVAAFRLGSRCELFCAENSRVACNLLRERGSALDIVLMDIQLKGSELDGIQLTKLIRGILPKDDIPPYAQGTPVLNVPIFFVTAYGERYAESELLAAGGTRVVQKPVDFVKLMGAMTRSALAQMTPLKTK